MLSVSLTQRVSLFQPWGQATVHGFAATGQLSGPATAPDIPWAAKGSKTRHLEIVGDSITAGLGCAIGSRNHSTCDGTKTEDCWLSWGAQLARGLGSEYSLLAWSAIGLLFDAEAGLSPVPMSQMFNYTLATAGGAATNNWFASRPPVLADAVVVNLGTNDFWPQHTPTQQQWDAAWLRMAATVRARYGAHVPLLAVCGPWYVMAGLECNRTRHAASAAAAAGLNVQYIDAIDPAAHPFTIADNNTGCVGHPRASAQQAMAKALQPAVAKALGWSLETEPSAKTDDDILELHVDATIPSSPSEVGNSTLRFDSVHAARDELRARIAQRRLPAGGARVMLQSGVHTLATPLFLDRRDSGTAAAPIVWEAAGGADPALLSAGVHIPPSAWGPCASTEAAVAGVVCADLGKLGLHDLGELSHGTLKDW